MDERSLSKEEFAALLQEKLPLNAERSQLHNHVRNQHKLIVHLFRHLAQQATSILELREQVLAQKEAIEALADRIVPEQQRPQLVGFDEPKVMI